MEYTDYCPNCDQQIIIEEFPGNYVFKANGGVVRRCPSCKAKLGINEAGYIIVLEYPDED